MSGHMMPRLEQILEEIERRGWDWRIEKHDSVHDGYLYQMEMHVPKIYHDWVVKRGGTPEEAAAKGLLWILKEGQDG